MKSKAVLLGLSLGMVGALVLGACSQPAATTTSRSPTSAPLSTTAPPSSSTSSSSSQKPQYGGAFVTTLTSTPTAFDPVSTGRLISVGGNGGLVNEQLIVQDWTQGLSAGGQVDWAEPGVGVEGYGPGLAESWTTPSPGTIVLNIRQGVHWALDPNNAASRLMAGREMTADDVVASFNYMVFSPHSAIVTMHPEIVKVATIEKTGPWQVTIKTPGVAIEGWFWLAQGGGFAYVFPPDVVNKYGNMQDWHNVVGTGPYVLSDVVTDTGVTFKRNSNYWETDPAGPGKGNQLPYMNEIRELIIPDVSTTLAALRTQKIDALNAVTLDDATSLTRTTPDLKYHTYYTQVPTMVAMRTDKTDVPFHDVKVRQALMMATDLNALSSTLYGGAADTQVFPLNNSFKDVFLPMAQLPQSVQALYQYNPDQAKKLLADAGYPDGFKTTMIVQNLSNYIDIASAVKAMWEKVGVDVTLEPKEVGVYNSIYFSRNYDQMMLANVFCIFPTYLEFTECWGASFNNQSHIDDPPGNDPTIDAAYSEVHQYMFADWAKADAVVRDKLTPYLLEQAFYIPTPSPKSYNFWWPWVKNYDGEPQLGFMQYHWIDQSLKTQMGK